MIKVKYHDTIEPMSFEVEFETETDATKWIDNEMQAWRDALNTLYPKRDVTWLNNLLDCSDKTEIYIPNTNIVVCCEIVR